MTIYKPASLPVLLGDLRDGQCSSGLCREMRQAAAAEIEGVGERNALLTARVTDLTAELAQSESDYRVASADHGRVATEAMRLSSDLVDSRADCARLRPALEALVSHVFAGDGGIGDGTFESKLEWLAVRGHAALFGVAEAYAPEAPPPPLWTRDELNKTWDLRLLGVHVWIERRPAYCDRGHFVGKVQGIATIDAADAFPRYYMSLVRAQHELHSWLLWRLAREGQTTQLKEAGSAD